MPTLAVGAAEEAASGRRAEQVFGVGRQSSSVSVAAFLPCQWRPFKSCVCWGEKFSASNLLRATNN